MQSDHTIAEIERLERMFALPHPKPLNANDLEAANRRHHEKLAHSPWFRLWQRYGICCRADSSTVRLDEVET